MQNHFYRVNLNTHFDLYDRSLVDETVDILQTHSTKILDNFASVKVVPYLDWLRALRRTFLSCLLPCWCRSCQGFHQMLCVAEPVYHVFDALVWQLTGKCHTCLLPCLNELWPRKALFIDVHTQRDITILKVRLLMMSRASNCSHSQITDNEELRGWIIGFVTA